jgi:mono/diheme cytochrome c family protein
MRTFAICVAGLYIIIAFAAHAGDSGAGRRLAQLRCAACHTVEQGQRNEVADAPPFVAIGRKFDFNTDSLILALMGPHAKMNFSLTRGDAENIADYIRTFEY